jgi:hypothetical protein
LFTFSSFSSFSFGSMGVKWSDLPPPLQDSLEKSISKTMRLTDGEYLRRVLRGCFLMELHWEKNAKLCESMFWRTVEQQSSSAGGSVAALLKEYVEAGMKWPTLSSSFQEVIFDAIKKYAATMTAKEFKELCEE